MTHLSAEQIARWIAGERTPEAETHVAGCRQCLAAIAGFEETLARFRSSAHSVAIPQAVWGVRRHAMWPRWVAVAAALVLLTSVPLYQRHREHERAELEQDTLLLQQVDAEISRAVPGSMDPLVQMVSWNAGSTERNPIEGQK